MPKYPGFIRVSLTCLALTPCAWAWTTQAETVRQTLPAPNGAHALAGSAPTLAPPAPGTLTAGELARQAQQYRDRGQWQAALALYRQGRQRFPDDAHFTAREIMTLADAGETDKALETARKALERQPRNTDLNLAQAYAFQRAGQPYSALLPLDRAVTLEPGIDYVKRAWILGLQQAGVKQTNRNAAIAGQTVLSDEQTRRLQADQLAARLRVLQTPARNRAEREKNVLSLINDYETTLARWQRESGVSAVTDPQVKRLQADRLLALHAAERFEDVVAAYEAMRRNGNTPPDYVLGPVASAWLALRKPDKAQALYLQALGPADGQGLHPLDRHTLETGLVYAYLENDRPEQAHQRVTQMREREPAWRRFTGEPRPLPNGLRADTELTWALTQLYVNDTALAESSLQTLVENAPGNTRYRVALAGVQRARNQPRAAWETLQIAQAQEPASAELIAEQGQTAMDLHDWKTAHTLLNHLQAEFPRYPGTRRLQERWDQHNKAELSITTGLEKSTDNPQTGSGDLRLETLLSLPTHDPAWRVYAGIGRAQGNFDEGRAWMNWVRAGGRWQGPDTTLEIEGLALNSDGATGRDQGKAGARFSVDHALNDQASLGGELRWRSLETPLRAIGQGIHSNQALIYGQWQANDHSRWRLWASVARFTDDNVRTRVGITGTERLYTAPRMALDLNLSASASHNTLNDAPYFNPKRDVEVLPVVRLEHTLHQYYDTRLTQSFELGAGLYAQKGYGSGPIALAGYGLRYQVSRDLEVGASLTGLLRPYDGESNRDLRFFVDLRWRF